MQSRIEELRKFAAHITQSPGEFAKRTGQAIAASAFSVAAYQAAKKVVAVAAKTMVDFTVFGAENPCFSKLASIATIDSAIAIPLSSRIFELCALSLLMAAATSISLKFARKFCEFKHDAEVVVEPTTPGMKKKI